MSEGLSWAFPVIGLVGGSMEIRKLRFWVCMHMVSIKMDWGVPGRWFGIQEFLFADWASSVDAEAE